MRPATHGVVEAAPAKINLYLHVVGRRPDGYHLLDSLVAFAEHGDELRATAADEVTLALDGPFAPALTADDDNLVLRAARAVAATWRGAALTLVKNLPVAAGLGGGSADAAAALRALKGLWRAPIDDAHLRQIALRLGADVPVCLDGRTAFIGGIGEEIASAPRLPPAGLVLVNPGRPSPTAQVFAAFRGSFSRQARFMTVPRDAAHLAALLRAGGNDLTAAAQSLVPEIGDALAALAASPGCLLARMSGSGATCFGLYDDRVAAQRAVGWIAARAKDWWVVATALRT
ncbi:MAG: 4-(cytidine 5'-diphospho)-2-C-methyl-D-erythritol kinase [Proteobacteria bacterium]|nr:4-(cytidine 5'-diphospho)-2-C-methyl-D-erythritol kinase [Pseudomonadota bacterium]